MHESDHIKYDSSTEIHRSRGVEDETDLITRIDGASNRGPEADGSGTATQTEREGRE